MFALTIVAQPGLSQSPSTPDVRRIVYAGDGPEVGRTVATALRDNVFQGAQLIQQNSQDSSGSSLPDTGPEIRVGTSEIPAWKIKGDLPTDMPADGPWMYARVSDTGEGVVYASHPQFLYALYGLVKDKIETRDLESLRNGLLVQPQFRWITGREDIHMSRLGYAKRRSEPVTFEDIEASFREAARLGCTHVVINEPASPFPHETGPAGEIYYWFYSYALDLDQYVETKLNAGTYPRDLLEDNLAVMKKLAELASKYGLVPGMYIANPRSVPESLLDKYPFLRGARIDHTYRAFEPRYTLTLAHPAVRWHYAEMIRKLLIEVPELGFAITLVNDSGSGFEYTASLYPGRNGGPYVVREWRPDDEIAKAAAENVIRYYRLFRDTARESNPDFRILTGLKNIAEEAEIILGGLDDGIDLRMRSQRSDYDEDWHKEVQEFRARGSELTGQGLAKGNPIIIGVPSPWQIVRKLKNLRAAGYHHVGLDMDPPFMVESDVNREALRVFQLEGEDEVDTKIEAFARELVGDSEGERLVRVWKLADKAVAATPRFPLYGGQGFAWYRFWARPFVPDISQIPEADRAYYQDFMLSIFNNPHNIDFGADALWTIHDVEESDGFIRQFDAAVWKPLDEAIRESGIGADATVAGTPANAVFVDTRDRLRAYKAYARTLRNIAAWIAGVHGYLEADDASEKGERLAMVRAMVEDELDNARELLDLWEHSTVDFIPISEAGETMHTYGKNLGDLVRKKIELMERYGHHEPFIDPNYMWRMPEGSELDEADYIDYVDHF
jgi:hypothetical protein